MAKKLFILPGLGNPKEKSHFGVYDVICNEAKERGYSDPQIVSYPGYLSHQNKNEPLKLDTSVVAALENILVAENKSVNYDVVCRSYGCSVFMNILLNNELMFLNNIILWGPSPLCNAYKVLMKDEAAAIEAGIKKGVRLSPETYTSFATESFEIQLMKYKGKRKIHIGTGELDKHCKPLFLNYLDAYLDYDKRFLYSVISNVGHEVDYPNKDYLNFLFAGMSVTVKID